MPKDDEPLTPAAIAALRAWIDDGARLTASSPPAPPPWEAPLAPAHPSLAPVVWPHWTTPVDRFVAVYLRDQGVAVPSLVSDAAFARRAYLDVWGLLPPPEDVQTFVADPRPG